LIVRPVIFAISLIKRIPRCKRRGSSFEADGSDNKFVDCVLAADALLVSNDKHFKILKETPFPTVLYLDLKEFIIEKHQ